MVMYNIISKMNWTFGTICKAMANQMAEKLMAKTQVFASVWRIDTLASQTVFWSSKNKSFCRSKDTRETKHACNVFWVAIAQFRHFLIQETAQFTFYNWVRLWQPSNYLAWMRDRIRRKLMQFVGCTQTKETVCTTTWVVGKGWR